MLTNKVGLKKQTNLTRIHLLPYLGITEVGKFTIFLWCPYARKLSALLLPGPTVGSTPRLLFI